MVYRYQYKNSADRLCEKKAGKIVLRLSQIKINISEFYKKNKDTVEKQGWENVYTAKELQLIRKKAASILGCKTDDMKTFTFCKRSIDARKKQEVCYNYSVDVELGERLEKRILEKDKKKRCTRAKSEIYTPPETGACVLETPPVVVGFGPAGMFCALELAKAGYRPMVLEQGRDVDARIQDVNAFWENGQLQPFSNVQFGEGGAGTFSDGKLNTTVKDPTGRNKKVLEIFVEHGAPESILYAQKPHIGTDSLCRIVKRIREHILALGGQVRFSSKVTDISYKNGKLDAIQINGTEWMDTSVAVFAIGHSARDTFALLKEKKIHMEQKPFAIGVRVEHKQRWMDERQYGELAGILPAADYKLTYQADTGRSIFSFCMCPGGFVVDASSEPNHLVVNGMSNQDRGEENANSALVVNVVPEDFGSEDVLAGVEFQRKWEHLAYEEGKGKVPIQRYGDFKEKQRSQSFGAIKPVHKGMTTFGNLWNCLPEYVCDTIVEGMENFGARIDGFNDADTLLSGVETRTSSPVRIDRDELFESNIKGIYPCGEGAGYAGGITSAAMDGLRIYEAIRKKYRPLQKVQG